MSESTRAVAQCGHYAEKIEIKGELYIPAWCDFCLEELRKNRMPLEEALDKLAKMIPPETMERITKEAKATKSRRDAASSDEQNTD